MVLASIGERAISGSHLQRRGFKSAQRHGEIRLRFRQPGACGRNWVERAEGRIIELEGTAEIGMKAGDLFVIETPGGGGYGIASPQA